MTDYDAEFFAAETRSALAAAEIVLPDVLKRTRARAVIDVGCGTGAWLSVAKASGCSVYGVDGFAPTDHLLIDASEFTTADISHGVPCHGTDLAICLEVGEHLPKTSAAKLVAGLCEADYVLWSAAIPGQGGVGHINEAWPSWWEKLFARHGYVGTDDVRRKHWNDQRMDDFYRQNLILWSTPDRLTEAGYTPGPVWDVVHPDLAKAKEWL